MNDDIACPKNKNGIKEREIRDKEDKLDENSISELKRLAFHLDTI